MRRYAFLVFILLLALVGMFFLVAPKGGFFAYRSGNNSQLALIELPDLFEGSYSFTSDTDLDGLSDAKEVIYGSDPKNPDSDNDGFLDGKEVKARFDPLVPGEGKGRLEDRKDTSLSVQYFSFAAQETGSSDPLLDAQLIDKFLSQKGLFAFTLPFVGEHEMLFTNDDQKKITDYLALTSKLSLPDEGAPFLALAKEVIQNQAFDALQNVTDSIEETRAMLMRTPVPASLKELHQQYIGVWLALKEIFSTLAKAQRDPVAVFLAQKKGEWLVKEIGSIEDMRAKLITSFRLQLLKNEAEKPIE